MRLATIRRDDGTTSACVATTERAIPLPYSDIGELLRIPDWRDLATDAVQRCDDAFTVDPRDFAPVIASAQKIVCCGHNYRTHIVEMGRSTPEFPTLFTKFADTLAGANDTIEVRSDAKELDWEVELGVVVGSTLSQADSHAAHRAIAGYTVANDLSVRSWQHRTSQWFQGKAFDATTPLGPVLVTPDACDPGAGLRVTCSVNGVVHQSASTEDLLFDPATLLAYISSFTTLRAGDVVLTGTPGGVGASATPPVYLVDGDDVNAEIEGIGQLRNIIRISRPALAASAS